MLRKLPFFQNVAKILQGNVVAQLMVIAAVPFLARFFPPDAFAVAQASTAIVTTAIVFCCLRYDVALTVCDDDEIQPLLIVVTVTGATASILIASALLVAPDFIFEALRIEILKPIAAWLAPSVLAAALANVMCLLAIRAHAFPQLALSKIFQSAGFVLTALIIGLVSPVTEGMLIADLVGRIVLLAVVALVLVRAVVRNQRWQPIKAGAIAAVLKRYRFFPLISLPGGLVNVLAASFNTVWMLVLFTAHDAGSYALVERLIMAPVALIGAALQQVYQGQFSYALRNGSASLSKDFRRLLAGLVIIAVIPTLSLVLMAPTLFPLVLGDQWSQAGQYCQVLAPSILIAFVALPFNMILTLLQLQKLQFFWEIGRAALSTGAWLISIRFDLSPLQALGLVSIATSLSYLAFLVIAYREVEKLERGESFATAGQYPNNDSAVNISGQYDEL